MKINKWGFGLVFLLLILIVFLPNIFVNSPLFGLTDFGYIFYGVTFLLTIIFVWIVSLISYKMISSMLIKSGYKVGVALKNLCLTINTTWFYLTIFLAIIMGDIWGDLIFGISITIKPVWEYFLLMEWLKKHYSDIISNRVKDYKKLVIKLALMSFLSNFILWIIFGIFSFVLLSVALSNLSFG